MGSPGDLAADLRPLGSGGGAGGACWAWSVERVISVSAPKLLFKFCTSPPCDLCAVHSLVVEPPAPWVGWEALAAMETTIRLAARTFHILCRGRAEDKAE